jgi:DNA-directed RNA polymerase subunit M/transcription elongation factor TFIIS
MANETEHVVIDTAKVCCPHCSYYQYIELSEFIRSGDEWEVADLECTECGQLYDVTLETTLGD